jgi:hypothetical protein
VRDLIGNELTPHEARLLAVYRELAALAGEPLAPVAAAGVRAALAQIAQVTGSLGLVHEHVDP